MKVNRMHHLTDKINKFKFIIRGISYAHIDSHWKYTDNIYPHNIVYIIKSGWGILKCNGKIYNLTPNHAYLIPCNSYFSTDCPNKMTKLYVCCNIYNQYHIDLFADLKDVLVLPYNYQELNILLELMKNQNAYNLIKIRSLILLLLSKFMETAVCKHNLNLISDIDEKYYHIMSYINNNLSVQLRVGDVAKKFSYTLESLSRDFKNATGINMKKYIDKLIIEKAQHLLISSDYSIREILDELGFNDRNHFSKYFKQKSKISPSDYRQSNRTE